MISQPFVDELQQEMNGPDAPRRLRAPSISRSLRNGWETTNLSRLRFREALRAPVILSEAQCSRRTCFLSSRERVGCLALLLFLFISPALLLAQFHQPTDEELKMTADPKAPGAAAVYLNIEEMADDQVHYRSFYARIKMLTEKGKELATVEIPYESGNFKISDIKARTIHADGAVIPLTGKPEDLLVAKTTTKEGEKLQFNRKVFNLPSVEVGSILEYRYQIHYDDKHVSTPYWQIQQPYFVHQAHYSFKPLAMYSDSLLTGTTALAMDKDGKVATFLLWTALLPPGMSVKSDRLGHYAVDVADVPPIPTEEWMPPIHSFLFNVKFYYKDANDNVGFWQSEAKRWSRDVDHFAEPSKSIHEAVNGLIAPGDSELDKAKKLYKAVQALDNTDFSRKKTETEMKELKLKPVKRAEDTWSQKSGSGNDIALLYLAMLRAAGLNVFAMKVVNRDDSIFDPAYLDADQLDDIIVIISIAGKEILLDPGQKMCPFQTVHWKHEGAAGIRQSPGGSAAAGSPPGLYTVNTLQRAGDLILDGHGAVTGVLNLAMTGQRALRWRQAALRNDEDEVKKQFDHWLESMVPDGVEAHIDSFTGLDNPDIPLIASVKANGNLGAATSKRLLLPAFFFETRGAHPFVDQAKRLEPVDMQFGEVVTDQIVYHLPTGFAVEGAPQDSKIPWVGYAVLVTKSKTDPGQITIGRLLSRAFTLVKPEQYQDLRGFYQKVAAADQAQLVLTRAPADKGNQP